MLQIRGIGNVSLLLAMPLLGIGANTGIAQTAWQTTTTPHFDCYFESQSQDRVNRVLFEAERAYARISLDLQHDLSEKVSLTLVSADVSTRHLAVFGRSGEPLKQNLVIAVDSDDQLEGTLLHELTHQFEFELVPIPYRLPPWVLEGLAEFERGRWMPSQPARATLIIPVSQLTTADRDGARAVVSFIADEFGTDGIRRLLWVLRDTTGDAVFGKAFGLSADEFQRRFEAYMKAY